MKRIALLITISIWSIQTSFTQNLPLALQNEVQEITNELNTCGVIGISTSIIIQDIGTWNGVAGHSELINETLMDTSHYLEMGSFTKSYTAALIMRLHQDGILELDDKLDDWLPSFPNINGEITIAQCLNHTSGLNDYINHPEYMDFMAANYDDTTDPALSLQLFQPQAFLPPGIMEIYSNSNYVLLGLIIESAANMTYQEYLEETILNPIGSNDIYMGGYIDMSDNKAHGHYDFDGDFILEDVYESYGNPSSFLSSLFAAGCLVAQANDVSSFFHNLFNESILDETHLTMMQDNEYGMVHIDHNGTDVFLHDGSTLGFSCLLSHIPSINTTVIVAMNQKKDQDECLSILGSYWDVLLTTSLLEENSKETTIQVFPNPAQDQLNIQNEDGSTLGNIQIMDMTGRVVMSLSVGFVSKTEINISHLSRGTFIVQITSESGNSTHKIIKK